MFAEGVGRVTGDDASLARLVEIVERPDPAGFQALVKELSYVGVATQYIVDTADGSLTVYVQNTEPGAHPVQLGAQVALSFGPDSAFVVPHTEEEPLA